MTFARMHRDDNGMNYWPGFVDALSTLILSIIFILTVFVVVQFYLQQEVAGKDTALSRLNAQIAQLTELLSMEKSGNAKLEDELAQLRTSLTGAETERDRLKSALEGEKKISARALAQVEARNQEIAALRRQLSDTETTLAIYEGAFSNILKSVKVK